MENAYYVYTHIRLDTGAVFYVGKGKGRRAFWQNQRNKHWKAIVAKAGFDVRFVAMGLSEKEAFMLEKETIAYYGRANLANYTDGGDGSSGAKRSKEFKELMRQKMLGRKFSQETIEKMKEAARQRGPEFQEKRAQKLRGRKHSEEHKAKIAAAGCGRKLSQEAKDKISKYHKGRPKNKDAVAKMAASKSKAVYCHNNGITYASMSEAARQLELKQSHISNVCHGAAKHTKGFIFSMAENAAT
jgi:hypothetical protein